MSSEKNFGVRKDVLEKWNILMEAENSFVSARARTGGSGVDLYILGMIIGLRIGERPPLRSLEDKFQYNQIADSIDLRALTDFYGIEIEDHVKQLGRFSGEGINYIYEHHFLREESMLDLLGLIETWSSAGELKRCANCRKFVLDDITLCPCGSNEF